jgi:hypothetical protein
MDGEAVREVAELARKNLTVTIDGVAFSPNKLHPAYFEPRPETLELSTLEGLAELINGGVDDAFLSKDDLMIHVADYATVRLYGPMNGIDRRRDLFAEVKLDPQLETFPFGRFMSNEEFQIKLRAQLVQTDDQVALLDFTSRLTVQDELGVSDDGTSQTAQVRRGMSGALSDEKTAPSIVTLNPYRTFREIEQVEGKYLFRMKADANKIPSLALFEAGGGLWRLEAVKRIREWLIEHLESVSVIV